MNKRSEWRLLMCTPTIGAEFNGLVFFLLLPIFFVSLIFKFFILNSIPVLLLLLEIYRMKLKLQSLWQVPKYVFFKYITGHYWHGYRRSAYASLTSVAAAMVLLVSPMSVEAGFTVIIPKDEQHVPNVVQQSIKLQPKDVVGPLGGEFINNSKVVVGAGPAIHMELLMKQIVPPVYTIEFKSVELASMSINWKSTNFTLDQVLGNLAMRYGIMFETMHGSSVLSIDWYDAQRCARGEKSIFKRICGTADGFYID